MAARSQLHAALGRAVKDVRTTRGISQEDLAHLSGMHRTYLGGIERGERNLSYASLKRLAQALEVPASDLLARAEENEDPPPG